MKGRIIPSGKYSSPCHVLISTTEGRKNVWFHLLPSLELAASTAFQIPFISYTFLHCNSSGDLKRLAAAPLQQGFAGESSPFCVLSGPAYPQWPVSFCVFQPAVASHPQPTAFMLQKLPSCIWSYWILPCLSWRNPGIPRQPFSVLSYPFLWPHAPNILQPDKGKFTDQLGLPT